ASRPPASGPAVASTDPGVGVDRARACSMRARHAADTASPRRPDRLVVIATGGNRIERSGHSMGRCRRGRGRAPGPRWTGGVSGARRSDHAYSDAAVRPESPTALPGDSGLNLLADDAIRVRRWG